MSDVRVSIVTPTYNSEKYIEETILSVLNQSYKNIQYIIIDGGSNDKTIDLIKKYKDKIDIFISEKDNGMYDAINKGLNIATGDIVAYINSDDVYYDMNTIKNVVEFFDNNKNIDWIYSDFYSINEKSQILDLYRIPNVKYKEFISSSWSYIPQPTAFWRKKIIDDGIRFDCNYKMAADYKFFLTLIKNYKFKKSNFVIAKFRMHGDSLSATGQKLSIKEMENIKNICGYDKKFDFYRSIFWLKYKFLNVKIYLKRVFK